jgi:S-adenosylmethionine decarboxylase
MGVSRSSFAELVLREQAAKFQINSNLPSLSIIKRERDLWMSQFRKGLADTLVAPTAVELNPNHDRTLGRHWLADFKISEQVKLNLLEGGNPAAKIQKLILDAANVAGATILNQMAFQDDETKNVVAVVVIQESHLSMHFIPKENYLGGDVFTCGEINFEAAIDDLCSQLSCDPKQPLTPLAKLEVYRGIMQAGRFIPGIGIKVPNHEGNGTALQLLSTGPNHSHTPALGRHVLMEFYLCDAMTLNDSKWVQKVFQDAIGVAGGELVDDFVHQFKPQGVSEASIGFSQQLVGGGFCDLTIHDYPELAVEGFGAYAAVGICDFSGSLDFKKLIPYLRTSLKSEKVSTHEFLRGAYHLSKNNEKTFISGFEEQAELPQLEGVHNSGMRRYR